MLLSASHVNKRLRKDYGSEAFIDVHRRSSEAFAAILTFRTDQTKLRRFLLQHPTNLDEFRPQHDQHNRTPGFVEMFTWLNNRVGFLEAIA